MLLKFWNQNVPKNPNPRFGEDEKRLILQIIHAGGTVERYYMAFPAAWIMDKYPNFVLARPEIFRRPWDSIVHPEEILVPGQKYYVVPIPTVRKLHKRMRKPKTIDGGVKGNDLEGKGKKNGKRSQKNRFRFSPSLTMIDETQEF